MMPSRLDGWSRLTMSIANRWLLAPPNSFVLDSYHLKELNIILDRLILAIGNCMYYRHDSAIQRCFQQLRRSS